MGHIPQISGKELIKALQKVGFQVTRQKGSHIHLERIIERERQVVTVPNHKEIRRGTLVKGILKPINLSIEDLKALL